MNRKRLRYVFVSLFLLTSIIVSGCGGNLNEKTQPTPTKEENREENQKLTIYTTFYPLYDFAQKIAGDKADVINIVPAGTEPHDFEPTGKDIVKMNEADMIIYNGTGFEKWIEKLIPSLNNKELVTVDTSRDVTVLSTEETGFVEEEEEHEEEAHEEEIMDPHYWLAPLQAQKQAKAIWEALVQLDPNNQAYYDENFSKLSKQLEELDGIFKDVATSTPRKELIVSHSAFGYLAQAYGWKQIAISGLSPSSEPTTKELQAIIEFAKQNNIRYILFETLVSTKIAEMVQREIGAEALVLNPLEGLTDEEIAQGKDYFSVMKENASTIGIALSE